MLEADIEPENLRRFARFKVAAPVLIERPGAAPMLGLTYDAAVGGCCITLPEPADWARGETLRLTFDGQPPIAAVICRCAGTSLAVGFEKPFTELVLDHSARPVRITADRLRPLPVMLPETGQEKQS
jgi:hypothetical protein